MSDVRDEFKFDNSGGMDEFDATINSAVFEHNSEFNNMSVNVEFLLENGTTWHQNYGIGKDWVISEDGGSVTRAEGDKNFHKQSSWSKFILAAMDAGAEDVIRKSGKTPKDASLLNGLKFHFATTTFKGGKEIGDYDKLMPVEYLGEGSTQAGQPAAAPTAELDRATRIRLEELASDVKANNGTHDDFIKRAFQLPGVDGNDAAEAAVLDANAVFNTVDVTVG